MRADYGPNRLSFRLAFRPFADAFQFRGRSTRTEVVSFWLLGLVANAGTLTVGDPTPPIFYAAAILWNLAWEWPWLALLVRRLHDQDRSGWWALVPLSIAPIFLLEWLTAPTGSGSTMAFRQGPWAISRHLGWNAWTIALDLIALGLFIVNLCMFLWSGTSGANRFGPDPRLGTASDGTREAVPAET
jgi:uncharacterized membrane protein YhaH (DUF805 family)